MSGIGIGPIVEDRFARMGAPNQGVKKPEPLTLARLQCLRGQRDQGARQREAALDGGRKGPGADGPGQVAGFDARQHTGASGAAPAVPVGFVA